MIFLIFFAFLAGVVTILSPCILPILPIVLSDSIGTGKRKPLGIVTGFILSFTFFTLSLSTLVKLTGVSADLLRNISVAIILIFGFSLLLPKFQVLMESLFSKLANLTHQNTNPNAGFWSGILIGLSLGLVWTPCVGPIIASVITLAATSSVNTETIIITLSYSIGTAIPMLIIMLSGRALFTKIPWLLGSSSKIQKVFGVLMILTALGIFFNLDRKFQTVILDTFPNYGIGLTKFEDNETVKSRLQNLNKTEERLQIMGKPLDQMSLSAPALIEGGKWFNSDPLTLEGLKGKVVLVDFWTYTCINCIRTLPYLKDWYEKYKDKGLVIIGVHTPEFEFEKNPDNVAKAIKDFEIKYPVMQDNDYATWKAYNNRFWPAKYFIDKNGKIVSTHFGEGEYDESEKLIQKLLAESGADISNMPVNNPDYEINSNTPEIYLGYSRMKGLASPERIKKDQVFKYTEPTKLSANSFAFSGSWIVGYEGSFTSEGSTLTLNFDSKDVFLVMKPKDKASGQIRVLLDGKIVSEQFAGGDVIDGKVKVDFAKYYRLIKLPVQGKHLLKLEFLDSNTEVSAFTFG